MDLQNFLDKQKIYALFLQLNTNGIGKITAEKIVLWTQELRHEITWEELENIMDPHDLVKDWVIPKQEFKALLLDITD